MSTDTDGARMAGHLMRVTDAATALAAEAQRQVNQHSFALDALAAENQSLRIVAHNLRVQHDEDLARINALEAELARLQHLVDESRKVHEANAREVVADVDAAKAFPWSIGERVEWRDDRGGVFPAIVADVTAAMQVKTTTENHGNRTFGTHPDEPGVWRCGVMTLHKRAAK